MAEVDIKEELTSSMTSVTEEDGSLSESDNADTSSNSNFSSVINSTDYNTDDKLTPCLNSISISKNTNRTARQKINGGGSHSFVRPFARNSSLPRHHEKKRLQRKDQGETSGNERKRGRKTIDTDVTVKKAQSKRRDCYPFTFDNPDNFLYTDFSNSNANPLFADGSANVCDDEIEQEEVGDDSASETERSFFPDMNSPSWFTARVFDSYWNHYNYIMDWYREHNRFVQPVESQSTVYSYQPSSQASPVVKKKKRISRDKKRRRARRRRASKAKQKEKSKMSENEACEVNDPKEDEETLEMEITEDMMEFFSKSFKHRLERDKGKQDEMGEGNSSARISIEQAMTGQQGPSSGTPVERPGARRAAEMKVLFGNGSAMIHGMETALQMTFDKFTDRYQPKLWPNMPLKMCFS